MNDIKKLLSVTEQKNSKIIEVTDKPLRRVLNTIIAIKDLNENEGDSKIVRIILINKNVVKLQTYDNGTPFIFVFNEKCNDFKYLEACLEVLCTREKLILSKINV